MSIPANQQLHVEIIVNGTVSSAGSNSKAMAAVFHYRRSSTPINPIVKTNVIAAWQSTCRTAMLAALNHRLTLANIMCRIINDAQDAFATTTDNHVGAIAGDSMPTGNAAFLYFKTGVRGRAYRGGKHLFPMSESDTTTGTDDVWNVTALANLAAAATAFASSFTDSGGDTYVPFLLSRKYSQLKTNATTVTGADVNAIAVAKRVGSMIHRKVKSLY